MFVLLLTVTSCNKDWTEEQYEQYVSIKAKMNDEGVTPIYVRYKEDGKYTYELPIIVSGSTPNEKNRNIYLAEDLDTLNTMNLARFGETRTDMYYEALNKEQFYKLPEVVQIPKGESMGICNIDFDLNGINMSRKWVVPLSIVDDDSYDYVSHPRKNYAKAILKINPFNDFSGTYSTSTQTVTVTDEAGNAIGTSFTALTRTAYVVDHNTVFFYTGLINDELEERELYKFKIKFLGADTDDLNDNKIEISCDNADEIGFEVLTAPESLVYTTAVVDDSVYPYLEHHYVTIDIEYKFKDVTSTKDADGNVIPIWYHVKGVMILERNINTLIPDEDQAIQW